MRRILRSVLGLFFPLRGVRRAGSVLVGSGLQIDYPGSVSLADGVDIGNHCTLRGHPSQEKAIELAKGVKVGDGCVLNSNGGKIRLGEGVWLAQNTTLLGNGDITIGDHTLLAPGITLSSVAHEFSDPAILISDQPLVARPIQVEEDVWIGMNASILPGVTIGKGAVIGAGAVVTKDVPPFSIAVGCPAKVRGIRGDKHSES